MNPEAGAASTQVQPLPKHDSLVELATPSSQVSAFCQAVFSKIIPDSFWGDDTVKKHNKSIVMRSIDHFIKLRRFEAMSLHEITQKLKASKCMGGLNHPVTNRIPDRRYSMAQASQRWRTKAQQNRHRKAS
jgi:telomerase reverse transcriptase